MEGFVLYETINYDVQNLIDFPRVPEQQHTTDDTRVTALWEITLIIEGWFNDIVSTAEVLISSKVMKIWEVRNY
jgi:hypothetical protein